MINKHMQKHPVSLAMRKLNQNYIVIVSLQSEQLLKEITRDTSDHVGKEAFVPEWWDCMFTLWGT